MKKITKIIFGVLTAAGLAVGAAFAGAGIDDAIESADAITLETLDSCHSDILNVLNKKTNYKVIEVVDVVTKKTTVKENDVEVEKGIVTVYAKTITQKGKEFISAFTFEGEAKKADKIEKEATDLFTLVQTENEIDGEVQSHIMDKLINYSSNVASFVKANVKTCTVEQVNIDTEVLSEEVVVNTETGETETQAYTGAGVLERYFDYLGQKGLHAKKEQDKFYELIEEALDQNAFETTIKIDLTTKTAHVTTTIDGLDFVLTIDVSSIITTTTVDDMKQEIKDYILKYLKASVAEVAKEISLIKSAETKNVTAKTIWSCINSNLNEDLYTTADTTDPNA